MGRLAWMLVMAGTAALGCSDRAWGAGPDWQPVVVVVGAIALVTLCVLGGLVWAFVAWVFGPPWRDAGTKTKSAGSSDGTGKPTAKAKALFLIELVVTLLAVGAVIGMIAVGVDALRILK